MTAPHLTDAYASSALSEEQLLKVRDLATAAAPLHVDVRFVLGRLAIVHCRSEEPVQFLVSGNAYAAKHLVEGWERHFGSLKERAR